MRRCTLSIICVSSPSRSDAALRPGLPRREHDWQLQAFFEHAAASERLTNWLDVAEPQPELVPKPQGTLRALVIATQERRVRATYALWAIPD